MCDVTTKDGSQTFAGVQTIWKVMVRRLTGIQDRFVRHYLLCGSATEAARRAGSKNGKMGNAGAAFLKSPAVRAAIDARRAELAHQAEVDQEAVVRAIANVAFLDVADIAVMDVARPEDLMAVDRLARGAIDGWRWDANGNLTLQLGDRARALDMLARRFGLYASAKVEVATAGLSARMERVRKAMEDGGK